MNNLFTNTWETAIVNPSTISQHPNSYIVVTEDRLNHYYDALILFGLLPEGNVGGGITQLGELLAAMINFVRKLSLKTS